MVALLVAFLAGCRGGPIVPPARHDIDRQLGRMRNSARPYYFAGREFGGLPLTAAIAEGRGRGFFAYGTCTIPAGQDGGCSPPLQIQIFRFNPSQWQLAANCHRRPSLLGVPTVRHDGLVLVSKGAIVKIYARSPAEDRRVALNLRNIDHPERPLHRLPMPSAAARALLASVCP